MLIMDNNHNLYKMAFAALLNLLYYYMQTVLEVITLPNYPVGSSHNALGISPLSNLSFLFVY